MSDIQLYSNNAETTLNGAITNVATSITVADGTVFNAPTSSEYELATLDDNVNIEIVRIDDVTGNVLTVVRGQEGTTGTAFADGADIYGRLTKGTLEQLVQNDPDGNARGLLTVNIQPGRGVVTAVASATYAVAVGYGTTASGTSSVAISRDATASAANAIAIGWSADANNTDSIAIGKNSLGSNDQATAVGMQATASGLNSVAVGSVSTAANTQAIAIGYSTTASAADSIAIGETATAAGTGSVALGSDTDATANYTIAIGDGAQGIGIYDTAIGFSADATGTSSVAIGRSALADAAGAVAIGQSADSGGVDTISIGQTSGNTSDYCAAISTGKDISISARATPYNISIGKTDFSAAGYTTSLAGPDYLPLEHGTYVGGTTAASSHLMQTTERTFFSPPVQAGAKIWTLSTAYSHNEVITPSTPNGYSYYARLASPYGGTVNSSGTEPTPWPTTNGGTIVEGDITWVCVDNANIEVYLPDYIRFIPTEVGFIGDADLAAGGTQPTISWGIVGTEGKWKAAIIATQLTGAYSLQQFAPSDSTEGSANMSALIDTLGTGVKSGRVYWKGIVVETLTA